jgi:hypothetical protein
MTSEKPGIKCSEPFTFAIFSDPLFLFPIPSTMSSTDERDARNLAIDFSSYGPWFGDHLK